MKVLLLNPPFLPNFVRSGRWQGASARSGGMDYPKWLAYSTGLLELSGVAVKLIDAPADKLSLDSVVEMCKEFSPDVVVLETNFSSLNNDLKVAKKLKEAANGTIIVVGPPVAVFEDRIIDKKYVDVVIRKEYDFQLKEVIDRLKEKGSLRGIDNVTFKKDGKKIRSPDVCFSRSEDLETQPFVSKVYKEHLHVKNYYLSQSLYPEVQIFAGRGCPQLCTFCQWPENLTGRGFRIRSVENLFKEFRWIKDNIPEVNEIFIEDDTFTTNKKYVKEFCQKLIDEKIKITWSCNSRADLDLETLKMMKKAGCRLLIVGFESGSDEILKIIKKGITTKQSIEFSKNAIKAGLLVHADFIVGLPGETKETAQQTLDLIKKMKPDLLQMAIASPIPGTHFYNYVKENGYLLIDDMSESIDKDGYQKCIVSYPDFTKDDIEYWLGHILKSYYFRPGYVFTFLRSMKNGGGIHHIKTMSKGFFDFMKFIKK